MNTKTNKKNKTCPSCRAADMKKRKDVTGDTYYQCPECNYSTE